MDCKGWLPESIGDLKSLQFLRLGCNLEGSIPASIGDLPQLVHLSLNSNNLSGQIPSSLANLTQLSFLDLSNNQFSGPITFHASRSLVNCSFLEVLDVDNNNIEDTFPHWLESLPNLQVLVLRANKFHGIVQSTKESPSFLKLQVLDLSNNDFLGPLPIQYMENFKAMMDPHGEDGSPEYMKVQTRANSYHYQYSLVVTMKGFDYELQGILTIFTSIDLLNNKFEGEIPDVIGKLSSLKGLNLSHNNLTGPISPSLGNLMNLEWLDLFSNELAGKIPNELVSLTQLAVLNLSNNHLVGRIPQGNQFSTFGNDSYEGNLGLCGISLSKSCNGNGTLPSSFQEKAEFWRFGWTVLVLGYGCGVVFGLPRGYHAFRTGKPKWFVSLSDGQSSQSGRKMRKAKLEGKAGGGGGADGSDDAFGKRPIKQVQLFQVGVTLQDGRTFEGTVVNADLHSDIAIVKIKSKTPLPAAKLGSSSKLCPGDWVLALGCPLSLQNTVTAGIVSCVDCKSSDLGLGGMHREYLQTDCAINPVTLSCSISKHQFLTLCISL
ncbi:hypothetical protein SLEP1_g48018 [Rubroshorea leprosula]|uniref:Disease resistance R13L4/SHOC-2-like LRR domain-containing protein n=1 Tax=Rubroshorea leprosula TaxID=152421 RepID=A0AAV5LT61_9ROSI|nr:hypothetical protein SLEP1_g48018 [Rubroshorea leprosula]